MYLRLNPYDELLQGMLVSLRIDEGIIKITGRNGTGKSALCSQLCEDLQANGQPAILFAEPPANAVALQDAIIARLQLDAGGNFTRVLSTWLQARNAGEKPLVLVFDDAQRLDPPTFSAIRMLCNIQSGSSSLVRVVLCGSDELDARIASPALRAVTQFISQGFTLRPLTREQVRDFRQAYCVQAGHDLKAIDERALDRLFSDTKGQPGLLYARLEQENAQRLEQENAQRLEQENARRLEQENAERMQQQAALRQEQEKATRPGQEEDVRPPGQQDAGPESVAGSIPDIASAEVLLASYDDRKPESLRGLAIVFGLLVVAGAGAYAYFVTPAPLATNAAVGGDAITSPSPAPAPAPANVPATNMPAVPPVAEPAPGMLATAGASAVEQSAPIAPELEQSAEPDPEQSISAAPDREQTFVTPDLEQSASPAPAVDASPAEAAVADAVQAPASVEDFIAGWITSWQAQDVEAYLAYYHPDFAPMQGTRAAWEQQRRRVIESARDIEISADAPQSNAEAQDGMRVVRFWLDYSAANYADRTLKELVLARADGAWRIRAERNLRTEAR